MKQLFVGGLLSCMLVAQGSPVYYGYVQSGTYYADAAQYRDYCADCCPVRSDACYQAIENAGISSGFASSCIKILGFAALGSLFDKGFEAGLWATAAEMFSALKGVCKANSKLSAMQANGCVSSLGDAFDFNYAVGQIFGVGMIAAAYVALQS